MATAAAVTPKPQFFETHQHQHHHHSASSSPPSSVASSAASPPPFADFVPSSLPQQQHQPQQQPQQYHAMHAPAAVVFDLSSKCHNRECSNVRGYPDKPNSIYCSSRCQSREQNLRQGRVKNVHRLPAVMGVAKNHLKPQHASSAPVFSLQTQLRHHQQHQHQQTVAFSAASSGPRPLLPLEDVRALPFAMPPLFHQQHHHHQHHHQQHAFQFQQRVKREEGALGCKAEETSLRKSEGDQSHLYPQQQHQQHQHQQQHHASPPRLPHPFLQHRPALPLPHPLSQPVKDELPSPVAHPHFGHLPSLPSFPPPRLHEPHHHHHTGTPGVAASTVAEPPPPLPSSSQRLSRLELLSFIAADEPDCEDRDGEERGDDGGPGQGQEEEKKHSLSFILL